MVLLTKRSAWQTTIMAVAYDGGVVLGADSRTSTGSYVANKVSDKIVPLTDNVWMCRSGSAADTQAIASHIVKYLEQHTLDVDRQATVAAAANLVMSMAYNNKDMLSAGMIVAGCDKYDGASVYAIPMGGSLLKVPFAIGGSGSAYITGYCDAYYKAGMSRDECLKFVRGAVAHAMSRDGSSGGICRTVVIDKEGVSREYVSESKGDLPVTLGDMPREKAVDISTAMVQ
jgi:20S proteasome subunit beta 1